jgi:hypothetical protein
MSKKHRGAGSVSVDVFVRGADAVGGYVADGGDIIVRLNDFPARTTLFLDADTAAALRDALYILVSYLECNGVPSDNVELTKIRSDANKARLDRELAEINEGRVD